MTACWTRSSWLPKAPGKEIAQHVHSNHFAVEVDTAANPQVLEPLSTSYLRFMMLHSCRAAPFLVAVLLGAYPASAVRTIVKLKECGYNRLNKAKVSDLKDGRVQVKFCEETVVLDSNQSQTDAWKSLMWWDPAQQGKKLTNQDLEILKSYLGQYDYSRPMGQIGHGLLPKNYEGFREDNRRGNDAAMVRAVLNFEVSLANTLNKLPATGTVELYRGGWTSAQQLQEMQAALDSGSAVSFPWFQSTTTLHSHASKFMGRKSEPEHCAHTCVEKGEAFPTFLTYKTCHGKNVEEWNRREQEWLLLPSLSFKLASISKVMNDPWWEATPKDMAEWLGQSHTVETKDWSRDGKMTYGPWPDIAAAVLAHSIDGRAFMKWNENRSFPEPYVKGKWDDSEYLYSDKTMEMQSLADVRLDEGDGRMPTTRVTTVCVCGEAGEEVFGFLLVMKRSSLLRKEQKSDRFVLTDDAASLAEEGTASYVSMTARSRFLPQYPTGPATCDGSKQPGLWGLRFGCLGVDPCSLVTNCSWPLHHDCGFGGGGFKICLPNKDDPDKCESGAECLLRCTGVFAEERGDGSKGLPACKDLAPDGCNGYYAADPDYENNGRGSECALNEDKTCGVKSSCGVQNPPESLGEKQCRAPEVYKMASNGSCPTVMTRPGKECKTQCLKGFSPSVEKLLCQEGGDFEPKAFSCSANPCTVLTVANALQSGCKEGPDTGAAVIESGLVCTTQCKEGYYRSDDVLRCYAQTLTPATFTCEAPCPVPTVQNAAQTGVCKEASDKILPFTSCTTQCGPGYTPSVTSMSCRNAVFSPATVVCNPDPCPAPTGVEFAHRKGPCQEGPLITSGSACTTQCLAGYTPSVASLSCTAATFTPATFTCVPNPCAIPEIEQAAGNGCRGIRMGQKVDSGKACVAVCKPGWSPNIKKLDCYAEKLTPSSFACEPDPCPIPFAKNQEGSGCLGVPGRVDGTVIESGETCRTECKEGYHASVERMSCMTGSLTPPSWSCIEDRCPAEGGVANAGARICEEGNSIESGKLCTTKCNSGYTPNHASLQCRLGKLTPHTFLCNPNPCAVPAVANRLGSGCSGLPHPAMVDHGTTCMTQCEDGYTPTVAELRCAAGTLAPTTFSCSENPCDAPDGIQNGANQLCREGRTLQSGSLCTTQCADGYTPSVASLSCSLGKLSPRTFSCNPLPCNTPRVDNRQGNGCKGKRGNTIDSGATCTPQCRAGFTPSESELRCSATVLTPATFACNPNPCAIPTVNKALGNGCNGVSGGMIDSGSKCQAACMPGYTPSVAELSCFASVFTPASFTCRPDSCTFPSVQYKSGSGCVGVGGTTMSSGATCTTQCASGYTPDVGELKCFAGVFTPSSFECLPSPCNLPSVANSQGNGCKGKVGTVMASGGVCKTDCLPGFEPSVAQLQCTAGRLSPTSFSCDELRCRAPTGLANAPSVGCAEGSRVRGGASCTPRCNAGYTPTVASLACKQGVFDPTTYACQPQGCSIPGVANAKNPRCAEGNNIAHGQRCSPECNDGFVASQSALSCMAGSLTPSSFSCLAPCTSPSVADAHQNGFCREGNRISHGGSCTAQCKAGFSATRGSLECNNGRLQGTASCQIEMPAMGDSFYNCWSGDPHFTCRNGRRSDPLVPGTHWVLKQSCPNSPNFMWIQGLYGPVSPSGAFGVAFGGMFLSKNVLTIRANNNPAWVVKWNDRNIQNTWTGSGGSWRYNLAGTNLVVSWNSRKIEVGLSYGVTYKANRHQWNRQNWRVSGVFYNAPWLSSGHGIMEVDMRLYIRII
eukprot:s1366_g2.t1